MPSINNASFSFRVSEGLKTEAFKVINEYGLTPSQVFNLFLTEIANTKTIPVNLSYLKPNKETLEAMNEVKNGQADRYSIANSDIFKAMQHVMMENNDGTNNSIKGI